MIGKQLSHFQIIDELGSGGMGDVYRARDTKLGRDVALKVLPPEFAQDDARRSRFIREAQAIAALKHPNIVTIYSVEEADGVNFIIMELIEGDTLANAIPKAGLSLDRFFEIAVPLADAVSSAHEHGITHRDLKPANIMFDRDGRVKVLDFGLAKLLAPDHDSDVTSVESGDTGVGQVVGTASYMSPEQAEGKEIDHRSDLFSLGIVLYEMATGKRAFKGDTQLSTLSAILKDTPQHISEIRPEMPRHLGRIINRCLEKSPDRRFQSAKEVRNDLEGLRKEIDSGDLSLTSENLASLQSTKSSGGRRWLVPAIVAGVVAIAAVVWMARPKDNTTMTINDAVTMARSIADGMPTPAEAKRKMAVVLPFDNLGVEEDAYFAAGMTDELTSRLSAVDGIGVISRTSATQYDRSGKTMKEIGEDLGVDYVIEGSVRFAPGSDGIDRVRITPLLVQVSDDTQLWSETFDRNIDDVFAVQTEIASQVAKQLGVTVAAGAQQIVSDVPTTNMKAYEAFIKARTYKDTSGNFMEYVRVVEQLYNEAVTLDPTFVEAWADLSTFHSSVYNSPFDRTESRLLKAREALERAEALAPNHHKTLLARGNYLYYCFGEYDKALEYYLRVIDLVPNSDSGWAQAGYIYRRQGKWAQHLETIQHALELDPRNEVTLGNIADTYSCLRDFEAALDYLDRAIDMGYDDVLVAFSRYTILQSLGRSNKELDDYAASLDNPVAGPFLRSWNAGIQRRFDEARELSDVVPEYSEEFVMWKRNLQSTIEWWAGNTERAASIAEENVERIRKLLIKSPQNTELRLVLAGQLAFVGRHNEATAEAKLTASQMAADKYMGATALETLALVYTIAGRHDEAIDLLADLLQRTYQDPITVQDLRSSPDWDPLRDNDRFKRLIPPTS